MKVKIFTLPLVVVTLFASCVGHGDPFPPIEEGVSVTINNTFQSTAFGLPDEAAIEAVFGLDEGALFATAEVTDGLEFDNYLLNLYDVDIQENSISFTMSAEDGDPTYGDLFRVIEEGTFDRYYLNFDSDHNVHGFTSDNSSVNLRIDSDSTLVVEISEGFEFFPGAAFTIMLN